MKPNFKRKVLKNGMTILFEKRDVPVVSVAFAVRAGGVNETKEERGISHFIEHLMYKGTKKRSAKQIAEEIEKNGGELNGFTSEGVVAYWCKMPSKKLDIVLDVLSDMVKNPKFDEKEMEKERLVIFEEIKMYKDNPRMHVFDEIQAALYEKPLGMGLAGTYETMKSIDRKKIVDKFKQIYNPNNMILAVVGDADFEGLVSFVEKNFGGGGGRVPKQKIKMKKEIKIEERTGIDQANLILGYHSPLSEDKKSYAALVLNVLMAGGMSSRLFEEIREKRNLAYAVKGDVNSNKDFAFSLIYVGTMKEKVEEVKRLILEEFEKVARSLGEKELKETKEHLVGNYLIGMEDSQSQMVNLLASEINGRAEEYYDFEKNIRAVKLEDVKKLASGVGKGYSFFALVPK
ncbi:MAG: pitrilysin family protein [archaeon]